MADDDTRERWQAVGQEVRDARQELRLTQAQLAAKVGVSSQVVSEDERGKDRGIPPRRLQGYAEHLHMDYKLLVSMAYGHGAAPGEGERPASGATFRRSS